MIFEVSKKIIDFFLIWLSASVDTGRVWGEQSGVIQQAKL
jgi:hypothetical protein